MGVIAKGERHVIAFNVAVGDEGTRGTRELASAARDAAGQGERLGALCW